MGIISGRSLKNIKHTFEEEPCFIYKINSYVYRIYRNETKWKKAIDINNILIMIFIVSGSSVILFIEFI